MCSSDLTYNTVAEHPQLRTAGGYAGLIPGFFGGIFYLYRMDLRKPSADPVADLAAEAEKASADPTSLIYFHNN